MKSPDDDFEFTIQEQIKQAADSAAVLLVVVEAGAAISQEDRQVAKLALKTGKPTLLAVNKAERGSVSAADYQRLGIREIVLTSATQGQGIEDVLDRIVKQLPKAHDKRADNRLKMALLGRPNVGKSSLFNSLAHKQQAIVADQAGTTRDVNRIDLRFHEQDVELLDTAGIRRPGRVERGVEHFSVLRALAAIEEADICLLLLDVTEPGTHLDQKIAGLIKEAGKGLVIVVSKWDLAEKDPYTRDQLAARIASDFPFVAWAPLIFTSAETGQNVAKLFELALAVKERRQEKLATSELNRLLKQAVDSHPPAGLKNRQPKLHYMTQTGTEPPTFRIFGKEVDYLHWSYSRHLERLLREAYDFSGTPIRLELTNDQSPRKR